MSFFYYALYIIFIIITPQVIKILCQKFPSLNKLGPVVLCYGFGFLISFIRPVPTEIIQSVAEIFLILAIPLFLFSSNISYLIKNAPKMLKAFLFSVISVFTATLLVSIPFSHIPFIAELSGGMAGVFTGGTLNLSALAITFGMPANTFILINTVDAILGGLYFLLLLKWGKSMIAKKEPHHKHNHKRNLSIKNFALALSLAGIAVGISYGLTILIMGILDLRLLFLLLTVLGLLGSRLKSQKKSDSAYLLGDYFILIFCFALSQLVDFTSITDNSLSVLYYTASVLLLTLIFYALMVKIFKIDKKTATMTHIAGVYGPAFVVVYADYLKKPKLILPSIAIALLGYTIGTFLGILVHSIIANHFYL